MFPNQLKSSAAVEDAIKRTGAKNFDTLGIMELAIQVSRRGAGEPLEICAVDIRRFVGFFEAG